jgi:hypothetical protein
MFFYSIFVLIVSHMVNSFSFLAMLLKPGCFALNLLKMFLNHRTSIFFVNNYSKAFRFVYFSVENLNR